jgi:hypothetical protein
MKRALLVLGACTALLAGVPARGAATELCFPPAFSARVVSYSAEWSGALQTALYWDVGAGHSRIDASDGTRYYFDDGRHAIYQYDPATDSCWRFQTPGSTTLPFCLSENARLVGAENVAGQSSERWCDVGSCSVTIYTVTERGVRIPSTMRILIEDSHQVFVDLYTDVVVHEHGVPPRIFQLPKTCAVLP